MKAWRSKELAKSYPFYDKPIRSVCRSPSKELVEFGRFPYTKGKLTTHDQQIVKESMEHLGLDALADQTIDTLSGGQLQRAYIAMVFCPRYRLYFVG